MTLNVITNKKLELFVFLRPQNKNSSEYGRIFARHLQLAKADLSIKCGKYIWIELKCG